MKKGRYTEEQIAYALRQAEAGPGTTSRLAGMRTPLTSADDIAYYLPCSSR
jgi:hypothetical protein